jgi:hypothetical protein
MITRRGFAGLFAAAATSVATGANERRLAVHRFPARKILAARLIVRETWGASSARVFEIMCYAGN